MSTGSRGVSAKQLIHAMETHLRTSVRINLAVFEDVARSLGVFELDLDLGDTEEGAPMLMMSLRNHVITAEFRFPIDADDLTRWLEKLDSESPVHAMAFTNRETSLVGIQLKSGKETYNLNC